MSKAKRNTVLLLLIAGILTLLLAMSLPNLDLSPGQPFSLEQPQSEFAGGDGPSSLGDAFIRLFQGFLAVAFILTPFAIFYSLLTREGRRRLLFTLILMIVLFMIAEYFQRNPLTLTQPEEQEATSLDSSSLEGQSNVPVAIFPEDPPSWMTPVVIAIISILIVIMVLGVVGWMRQRMQPPDAALEQLAEAAQTTLGALQQGQDFEVTIIRCYHEMSQVVKAEKGIARQSAMTPREFEEQLVRRGLPQEAVRTLTRLFEQVRYGRLATDTGEEKLALACLTDIVRACGGQA